MNRTRRYPRQPLLPLPTDPAAVCALKVIVLVLFVCCTALGGLVAVAMLEALK